MAFTASPTNTSKYIVSVLPQLTSDCAQGKLIVAHLGDGASMCAIERFPSIATTMSFIPVDGLIMGTRTGALGGLDALVFTGRIGERAVGSAPVVPRRAMVRDLAQRCGQCRRRAAYLGDRLSGFSAGRADR